MQQPKEAPIFAYDVTGDDPVVVSVRGEIDVVTGPQLSSLLDDLTLCNRNLVLDLGAVEFMDSTGLYVLEKVSAALHKVGGTLQLASVSERVRRVFELSGMDKVLPLPLASDTEES